MRGIITLVAIIAVLHSGHYEALAVDFLTLYPVDDGNPLTDDRGRANTDINTVPFKRNALQTVGNQQFTSYYHHDGRVVVGRRQLGANEWELFKTEFTSFNINDAHNVTSFAVDGDGILHMSWGLHGDNLLYTKSTGSVLGDAPIELIGATVGNSAAPNTMTGLYDTAVTYPEFYNLPDGNLLFTYRNGGSGNGDYRLRHYDTSTDAWSELGPSAFNHIWLGRQEPGSSLPNVNAYPNQLAFDSQGNIHATWTWRTGGDTTTEQQGFQTNHHLLYARSQDGGVAWTKMDGTLYTLPIYETNAEIAINLPEGSSIINTTGMAIDKLDQPVVASWWAPEAPQGNHARQYMLAWYDNSQSQWRTSQISNRTIDGMPSSPLSESRVRDLGRPIVVVDDDNRVIIAYRDNQDTNGLTIAFSESTERNDWQFLELTTENLGAYEPTYDHARWERDGILSMLYQPVGLGSLASDVSVLEWDARAYFADFGLPKLTLSVDRSTGQVSIVNASGEAIEIDGYSIRSASAALNPQGWTSFQSQLPGDWTESNVSATQLNELNPTGLLRVADETTLSLGAAYAPQYTHFGQSAPQDLVFEFNRAGENTGVGLVTYTGVSLNNLVLMVDPDTGAAELHNSSPFDVSIDAYTVASDSSSLSISGWESLETQGAEGGTWVESNASSSRLSELNPLDSKLLEAGSSFSLGRLFNASGEGDLAFEFAIAGELNARAGVVLYVPLGLPGDYNGDGMVDAADYTVWRDTLGSTTNLAADGNANGTVDLADYQIWKNNFGMAGTAGAVRALATVPEPPSLALLMLALLVLRLHSGWRRREAWR